MTQDIEQKQTTELTTDQKAFIYDLLDFLTEIENDPEGIIYDEIELMEKVEDFAHSEHLNSALQAIDDMGWGSHREHSVY